MCMLCAFELGRCGGDRPFSGTARREQRYPGQRERCQEPAHQYVLATGCHLVIVTGFQ